MAAYYGTVVIPTRPNKPRDKGKAENAVQVVERWIMAPMRNRTFFSLYEVNQAIRETLTELNNKPFQKLEGTRRTLYEKVDKPALKPLPGRRYEYAEWRKAKVNIDHHVEVDHNYYSVPHQLVRQDVDVRLTDGAVEVLKNGKRVASHPRATGRGCYITQVQHRPLAHQKHLEWTPSRLVAWAESIGPQTGQLVNRILESKPHPEQGYRGCLGIMRLGKSYGQQRIEAAAARALACGACSYTSVKSILQRNLDQTPLQTTSAEPPTPSHQNLRGPGYYAEGGGNSC
jgi:transposase